MNKLCNLLFIVFILAIGTLPGCGGSNRQLQSLSVSPASAAAGRPGAIHRDRPIQFHANVGVSCISKLVAESADYRPTQQHVWSWAYQPAIHGTVFRLYRTHYRNRARTCGPRQFKPFHLIYNICTFGASTCGHPGKWICGSNSDHELPLASQATRPRVAVCMLYGRMNE